MIQGLLKDVSEQERQLAAGDKEDEDLGEVNAAKEDDKETMYWRLTWLADCRLHQRQRETPFEHAYMTCQRTPKDLYQVGLSQLWEFTLVVAQKNSKV